MPLKLKPVRAADLERLVQIEVAALKGLEITRFLCPDGIEAPRRENMLLGDTRAFVCDTTANYMQVIDTDNEDKILAFAKWQIPGKLLTNLMSACIFPSDSKSQLALVASTDGTGELSDMLSSQAIDKRKHIMRNEPHCFLAKIATDPECRRQGAAGILLREMCKVADEHKIASYLESSPTSFNLYKMHGFVEVDKITVDLKPWGGMGDYVLRSMVRPASKEERGSAYGVMELGA